MTGQLTLSYHYDSSFDDPTKARDDFGSLRLSVQSGDFSGRTAFWVQWQDVREMAERLSNFPASGAAAFSEQWGYNLQEGDDLIIRLKVERHGSTDFVARVELADGDETSDRVRTQFRTTEQAILWFAKDIARVMDRELGEAVLVGR